MLIPTTVFIRLTYQHENEELFPRYWARDFELPYRLESGMDVAWQDLPAGEQAPWRVATTRALLPRGHWWAFLESRAFTDGPAFDGLESELRKNGWKPRAAPAV